MSNVMPALADINLPPHVKIEVVKSFETLMLEVGRRSMLGYAGESFFGTAFIQGSRLQFTTAMPIQKMVEVSKMDRSQKKATVNEVTEHSNRPKEASHAKNIRNYLIKTACTGEKFILPAFTFNYGVGLDTDAPEATLIVFAGGDDGTNAWPAILLLPRDAKLDTTDGAHRRSQIDDILKNTNVPDEQKDALKRNAVDVKIVFENSRADSHQDFADCGKAKAIAKSLITTFDVRDWRNQRSRDLVRGCPFLSTYVDATASNVNLSSKSKKIWSMSALRMFVAHVVEHHPDSALIQNPVATAGSDPADQQVAADEQKTKGAEEFFTALARHLPQLSALEKARKDPTSDVTTGSLRDLKGGDVALRGIGMSIFARAFLYCKEHDMAFDIMASKLATVDWNLLACERDQLPTGPMYANAVISNAKPMWKHLLVVGEARYRVSSSSADADIAWATIRDQVLEARRAA